MTGAALARYLPLGNSGPLAVNPNPGRINSGFFGVGNLHGDLVRALLRAEIRERLESQGDEIIAGGGEQLAERMRSESALYARIIKSAGLRPE